MQCCGWIQFAAALPVFSKGTVLAQVAQVALFGLLARHSARLQATYDWALHLHLRLHGVGTQATWRCRNRSWTKGETHGKDAGEDEQSSE